MGDTVSDPQAPPFSWLTFCLNQGASHYLMWKQYPTLNLGTHFLGGYGMVQSESTGGWLGAGGG